MYNPIVEPIHTIIPSKEGVGALYLGSLEAAQSKNILQEREITAVLTIMSTREVQYSENMIHKFIRADDAPYVNISIYFSEAISFIRDQLKEGNVLVHCHAGVSRSATIILAFLMQTLNFSLQKAYNLVQRQRRIINPNPGFMKQLKSFETYLRLQTDIHSQPIKVKNTSSLLRRDPSKNVLDSQKNYKSTADLLRPSTTNFDWVYPKPQSALLISMRNNGYMNSGSKSSYSIPIKQLF